MIGSWRTRNTSKANTGTPVKPTSRDLFLPRGTFFAFLVTFHLIGQFFGYCCFFILDIQEVQEDLPSTCKFRVPNPNELYKLEVVITPPRESMWYGGKFKFAIEIPVDYKYAVCLD